MTSPEIRPRESPARSRIVFTRRTTRSSGNTYTRIETKEISMLDYLRIMLNARIAKMDERGASAVEYGLLVAGIAALIVAVVFLFGAQIRDVFADTCDKVQVGSSVGEGC
jgi:pilus assembly protein Flp/PilA